MTVALVTGAAAGIGRATAVGFGREGTSVVVVDVAAEGSAETVELVRQAGGDAVAVTADVRRTDDLAQAVAVAVSNFGGLDHAVNNAGVTIGRKLRAAEIDEEDWRRVIDVNLTGVWLGMRHQIPALLERGGGSIVNVSSVAGLVGSSAADAAYAASKHGIIGLTKTAALDYATSGIRVNAVCPGPVQTQMVAGAVDMAGFFERASPMERLAEPDEIAAAIVWLCSPASSFVTGAALSVDGGYVAR